MSPIKTVRVNYPEAEELEDAARRHGLPVSAFIRAAALAAARRTRAGVRLDGGDALELTTERRQAPAIDGLEGQDQ